jgi:hypothetical protein
MVIYRVQYLFIRLLHQRLKERRTDNIQQTIDLSVMTFNHVTCLYLSILLPLCSVLFIYQLQGSLFLIGFPESYQQFYFSYDIQKLKIDYFYVTSIRHGLVLCA